MLDNKFRIY